MKKRTYKILDLAFIFTSLVLVGFLFWQFQSGKSLWVVKEKSVEEKNGTNLPYVDKLTGLPSDQEEDLEPIVVAIMIDNNPESYPQSGLNEAKVVYEAQVEGGMTRFMAIFSKNQQVEKVGPVRSARPDYFDWVKEYGMPLYIHCGGSPEALSLLKTERGLINFDEFYHSSYFWRIGSRFAPYNLYTSSSLWQKAWSDFGRETPVWQTFLFGQNMTTTSALKIEVPYTKNFLVSWEYNAEKKVYERFVNGKKYLDDQEEAVITQTLIITKNKIKILDEIGRRAIYNIGSGEVYILAEGKMVSGTWKKTKAEFRTRFYDENGAELSVPPGKIWFMSVPQEANLEIF
jgi:hypothetical protein